MEIEPFRGTATKAEYVLHCRIEAQMPTISANATDSIIVNPGSPFGSCTRRISLLTGARLSRSTLLTDVALS